VQTISLTTRIQAPAMRCFLLSLNVDLHMNSTARTRERAIAGVTHGLIGHGESVTWEGRHFGFMRRHTSKIVKYEPPGFFRDVMTKGMFKSFVHDHSFEEAAGETVMQDELQIAAPLNFLGTVAERLVLRNYLSEFLAERSAFIKQVAESEEWRQYLPQGMTSSFQG
jgi:ligand-binding SRPBCC domain-containing protein